MIQLWFFVAAGLIVLLAFLLLGLQGPPTLAADDPAVTAVSQMVKLSRTSFVQGDLLMDETDYLELRTNPDLHSVAAKMRRDRRRLTLLWINKLLIDLKMLRCFRRFLIQQGASTSFNEEWLILRSFLSAILFLNLLRILVITFGPFAFTRVSRRACHPVDVVSGAVARILGGFPSASWPELQRTWMSTAA